MRTGRRSGVGARWAITRAPHGSAGGRPSMSCRGDAPRHASRWRRWTPTGREPRHPRPDAAEGADAEVVDEQVLNVAGRASALENTATSVCPTPGAGCRRASAGRGGTRAQALRIERQRRGRPPVDPSLGSVDDERRPVHLVRMPDATPLRRDGEGRCYRAHLLVPLLGGHGDPRPCRRRRPRWGGFASLRRVAGGVDRRGCRQRSRALGRTDGSREQLHG